MDEAVPGTLILSAFLLLTGLTFFSLLNLWTEHHALLHEAALLQESRLGTSLEISDVALSESVCPNYSGPYDATVVNAGATSFADASQMELLLDYVDSSDDKVAERLQHGADWSVSSLTPDDRNPGRWDPGETGTVSFSVVPGLKPDTSGVLLMAAPQGASDSKYFTCPAECSGVTGFLSPTAEAADGDDGFEVSPANAFADDGNAASSEEEVAPDQQDSHQFFNYGFSVHDACEVQGIEVRTDWWLLDVDGDNSTSVELSWDGGASWTAAQTDFTETTGEHTEVLGSDSDTWGHTWSPSELDDSNFRVRVATSRTDPQTFFLDWVAVNVYFAPP